MDEFMKSYDGPSALSPQMAIQPPSPLERLKQQKQALEQHLSNINAAIDALEQHPEVSQVLEVLAKVRY